MCIGTETLATAASATTSVAGALGSVTTAMGQAAQGSAAASFGRAQQHLAEADALYVEDAARQQAGLILRAARRQKGAARAATAASGARIDEFAVAPEEEIERLAQEDAAMTILSGQRQGRSLRYGGVMSRMAGENERSASLFRATNTLGRGLVDGLSGWKGAKSDTNRTTGTPAFYDGTTGDFAFQE